MGSKKKATSLNSKQKILKGLEEFKPQVKKVKDKSNVLSNKKLGKDLRARQEAVSFKEDLYNFVNNEIDSVYEEIKIVRDDVYNLNSDTKDHLNDLEARLKVEAMYTLELGKKLKETKALMVLAVILGSFGVISLASLIAVHLM